MVLHEDIITVNQQPNYHSYLSHYVLNLGLIKVKQVCNKQEFSTRFLKLFFTIVKLKNNTSNVCRNDAVRFLYLVLKSFSVSPMYVSVVMFSLRVTVAW